MRQRTLLLTFVVLLSSLGAFGQCATPANAIVAENCLTGNPPSEWQISGAGDANIQGFATEISVNRGETVRFKVDTNASSYRLDIYRMGYYGGNGARKVASITPSATLPQTQPSCLSDSGTGLIDCGNWAESASWTVPAGATSGIYFAKLVRTDATSGSSHIFFIVRDDSSHSDILFQTSDTTWQAYNDYGGRNLYTSPRAFKVSYNRPFHTVIYEVWSWVFNAEYPMIRWLEANGYDVTYFTGVDADRRGTLIKQHKIYLPVGHDEYWSGGQRSNVESARGAGVHLGFFTGNGVFWKTRWENSTDGSNTPYRTLVCYKETHAGAVIDPQDPPTWTGTWRDPRFSPPADGGRPENALMGTIFTVNGPQNPGLSVKVPSEEGKMRFWRNTSIANLASGQTATLAAGTLGYEWDEDLDNGARPAGVVRLSAATYNLGSDYLLDFGSSYGAGTATHRMTLYRHASGALVFGAGTVQWSWGLDANHDNGYGGTPTPAADVRMQQATVNLLADMGAQPGSIRAGVTAATASTDTQAPTSTITSPVNGATVQPGTQITISGTATDTGGVVAGVEVSTDGGTTWHPATGRASWTYAWTPPGGSSSATIRSRAVDDSANLEIPSAGVSVNINSGSGGGSCPCSIWSPSATPASTATNDPSAVELGVKFQSDVAGFITGIRYYKAGSNTGTHIGSLWSSSGTRLGTATFVNETTSGWQQVNFSSPVAINANTTYIASYHTNVGNYSYNQPYFATAGTDAPPLHALSNSAGAGNGVYVYSAASAFPNQTYQSSNYWVDVVFATSTAPDTTPPTVVSTSPANNASGVGTLSAVNATFSEGMNPSTISNSTFELRDDANSLVSATVSYDASSQTASLQPTAPLQNSAIYSARVVGGSSGVKDLAGNAVASDVTWSFTTSAPPPPPPDQGPGGPILVITSSANPYTTFLGEILRNEGFNLFKQVDIGNVSSATLATYDVALVGEMVLSPAQVTMLTDWVNGGGALIAMKPDSKLATLLGLSPTGSTRSDAYLLVDTSTAPGAGIVGETIQYHGAADLYTLNGANAIATLYSSASAATSNPAVTLRSVGTNGGQAAAFTYDLARSVIYTRQGNPAWAGQDRDGQPPVRSDDLFFGGSQADFVDLTKVAIPQADEQQRLLANLIIKMNLARKPLPRFWYLPRGKKAAVVMTGDDHAGGGTAGRFDAYVSKSPAGCSVANWECVRSTSYIYPGAPLTNAQAASYTSQGFEVALHVTTSCLDFTAASLENNFASQLADFQSKYTSIPAPTTNRTHCIVWSTWDGEAVTELNHSIRFDANYYYWPGSWINNQPGLFTGSGMPMRFASASGALLNVYQATTQLTDESGQTYPFNIDTLLDNALGSQGYYGVFTANIHTDTAASTESDAVVNSALTRGVPVVSSLQMLTWLDGRNDSSFGSINWTGSTLTFNVAVGQGANGLTAMLPNSGGSGTLTSLSRNGSPVSFSLQTVKGIQYAFFTATGGSYTAQYSGTGGGAGPVISNVASSNITASDATISWTTDTASDSQVEYGTTTAYGNATVLDTASVTAHSANLSGLTAGTLYHYRVKSRDANGNLTVSGDFTFTTTGGASGPVISNVASSNITTSAATISWTTDTASDSQVEYGTTTAYGNATVLDTTSVTAHSASLSGLTAGTLYHYRVKSRDANGNLTVSGDFTFTTSAASGPVISSVASSNVTANGATITWTTDIASDSQVEYGTTTAYGSSTTLNTSQVTSHSVNVSALTASTLYHYRVKSRDANGNLTVSGDFTFTTSAPPGPVITNVTSSNITSNTARIQWTTNVASDTQVEYGTTTAYGSTSALNTTLVTAHTVNLSGLNQGTLYHYRVRSRGSNGTLTVSGDFTFTTVVDVTPPVISAVAVSNIRRNAVAVSWTTNEVSTTQVEYGTTTAYGSSTALNTTLVTSHKANLNGLTRNTLYHYRVKSADRFGNAAVSADGTFQTAP